MTSYRPEEQASRVKGARRNLEVALDSKKSSLKQNSRERPLTAFSQEDEEEAHPRPKRRPGRKQRAAYQKRMAESEAPIILLAEPKVRLLPTSKGAPRPAGQKVKLLPSSKAPPWQKQKGKSKGKTKKGKGKSGGDHRQAEAGKGQSRQRQPQARG